MEYAVQTRDYNHDYRWSWEESGPDSLRAKVSLELQNLIEDGKPGVAVIFREGSYHVIITAIYKLGDKPIGTDFSSANIRLNLVFSQITLKKAKGIVQYYLENQSNPGAAFSNIVTWTRDKWKINEEQIVDAFNSIQEGSESGIALNCEKGSELKSLLHFDWGQTEGAKYVYQPKSSNPVRIAVDPIPEKPLPPPEPPKISYWKRSLLLFLLLLAALAGLAYQSIILNETRTTVTELNKRPTEEMLKENKATLVNEINELKSKLELANNTLDGLHKKLSEVTGTNNPDEAIKVISGLQNKLKNVETQLTAVTDDNDLDKSIETITNVKTQLTSVTSTNDLGQAIENIANVKTQLTSVTSTNDLGQAIVKLSSINNQISELKTQLATANNKKETTEKDYNALIMGININETAIVGDKTYYYVNPSLIKIIDDKQKAITNANP